MISSGKDGGVGMIRKYLFDRRHDDMLGLERDDEGIQLG